MTSAAIPTSRHEIPDEFKAQPAPTRDMGCPMCRKVDQLVADIPVTSHLYIRAYDVGTTTPELDYGGDAGVTEPPAPKPTGIRCLNCRWSYTGPDPERRLVIVE